jgi:hypothetical protein
MGDLTSVFRSKPSRCPKRASSFLSSGLLGHQLVFKLSIFQHARAELLDHGTLRDAEPSNLPWWKRWRDLFKPTLKAANVILGSLAKVVPILEPIKEYKESAESGVELGQALAEGDAP